MKIKKLSKPLKTKKRKFARKTRYCINWKKYWAIKAVVLQQYGNKCQDCGETNFKLLHLHHVHKDGRQHRRELNKSKQTIYEWALDNHCPTDLELLCKKCHGTRHPEFPQYFK